jgi:sugar phosphate isomerase/epimerase
VGGVPREVAGDADRIFPGEGDFPVGPTLDALASIGYDGYLSLEVLNPSFWSIPADYVADLGRQALARALGRHAKSPDRPVGGA